MLVKTSFIVSNCLLLVTICILNFLFLHSLFHFCCIFFLLIWWASNTFFFLLCFTIRYFFLSYVIFRLTFKFLPSSTSFKNWTGYATYTNAFPSIHFKYLLYTHSRKQIGADTRQKAVVYNTLPVSFFFPLILRLPLHSFFALMDLTLEFSGAVMFSGNRHYAVH